jgi:hypothetical protein
MPPDSESQPAGGGFDPTKVTVNDLKRQPLSVVRTELPALAEALGVSPAELFRTLAVPGGGGAELENSCCHSDSW